MKFEPFIQAVEWKDNSCLILDQTRLPREEAHLICRKSDEVAEAIRRLAVRGAPAIGIAAAYGVVLAWREYKLADFESACRRLVDARPTAVNLKWAVDRMTQLVSSAGGVDEARLLSAAKAIHAEDIQANRTMAESGSRLLEGADSVITYCNTGDLATGGLGTAFGVIHRAFLSGYVKKVFPCETRPVGQGLRLTVWELQKKKIPYTLICDNMAATVMKKERIGAVLVGADRIAANGDAANKVGTYSLAVQARFHKIPFYVVAPTSTFDLNLSSGAEIPIEERSPEEIFGVLGLNRHPEPVNAWNPSFDVAPAELITGIICERGVILNPTTEAVKKTLGGKGN